MNKLELTREELTTILQVATGNVKDFVMDNDKFIDEQLKLLGIANVVDSNPKIPYTLHHPEYGYCSPKELLGKGISLYTGLTNQGDRITCWEYKMIDGREYIANHLMQDNSVTLLKCP